MAHPYGDLASLQNAIGVARTAALAVLDTTNPAYDDNVIAGCRDMADNEIDSALGTKYSVPFDIVTSPVIKNVSDHITAALLYAIDHPEGADFKHHRTAADTLLARFLSAEYKVPGATLLPADEGPVGFAYRGSTPKFAGVDDDDDDRTADW